MIAFLNQSRYFGCNGRSNSSGDISDPESEDDVFPPDRLWAIDFLDDAELALDTPDSAGDAERDRDFDDPLESEPELDDLDFDMMLLGELTDDLQPIIRQQIK